MILFLAYVFFALAFIIVLVAAYNIYCIITLRLFKKEVCESPNTNVEDTKTKFNLFIWIIKKSRKVKNASSPNEIEKAVKKKVKTFTFVLIFAIFSNIYSAFEFVIYGSIIYTLNQQLTTVASAFNTIFGHDEDCPCYALCTGNEEDDIYSVYELLFGPDEYNKLIGLMDLTDEEYERFYGSGRYGQELKTTEEEGYLQGSIKVINTSTDGRAKSEFIRDHINDDMVNAYRDLVSHNPKFRHGDGNDRSKMTQEQLREDLYKLLSDYKVHGRNPNCKCNTANKLALKKVCLGEEHWHEGWTWGTFYYPEPTYDEDGNPIYPEPGPDEPDPTGRTKAKDSQYGIELDNGEWYYWYQQRKSCMCAHNVNHPTYGRYGSIYLYSPNSTDSKNTAAARGCSTYSTAMAISNALQMEVTPYNVILDLMGGTLSPYLDSYILSGTDGSGLILSKAPPTMTKSTFAARITSYYKKYGLEANAISLSKANVDAVLDKGGFVQCSVKGKFAWYGGDGSHFIVIRKRSGDSYYCLDSAVDDAKAVERMTTAVNWTTLSSHFQNADGISYWAPASEEGGDTVITDPSACYSTLTVNNGTSVDNVGGIGIYNGWPWSNTSNLTFVNMEAYKSLFESDVKKYTGLSSLHTNNGWYGTEDWACAATGSKDGVACFPIVWHDIWSSRTRYSDAWANLSGIYTAIGYKNQYAAVLLEDSSGKKYFLPIIGSDAKRHTWPGGAFQTYIGKAQSSYEIASQINGAGGIMDKNSIPGLTYVGRGPNGDYGKSDGGLFNGDAKTVMTYAFNTSVPHVSYAGGGYGASYSYEMNKANISKWNTIKSNYKILGVVVQGL